jgi:hypothetical protein
MTLRGGEQESHGVRSSSIPRVIILSRCVSIRGRLGTGAGVCTRLYPEGQEDQ